MSDYIKREDAEKVVADYLDLIGYARRFAKSVLDNAPSADVVERKRGEWILTPYTDCGSPVYECSVCTHGVSGDLQVRNFCPNCGCSMERIEKMSGVKGINAGVKNWNYKHGETKTRLFKIWSSMHERCERPKHTHYKDYGGRGIKVCKEWGEYVPFAEWARANGYTDSLSIDRIDVNGNYEPSNCRWIPMKEQHSNKRSNRVIEYKGKMYTLTQLAEYAGIKKTTLRERLNNGWSVEDAVEKPVRARRTHFWIVLDKPPADMREREGE